MNIVFRIDASPTVGFGHIIRCLSIANSLKNLNKFNLSFIVNNYDKAIEMIAKSGFYKIILPENIVEEEFLLSNFQNDEKSIVIFDNLNNYSIEFIQKLKQKHKVVMVHSYSESRFSADIAIYPAAHLPEEFISDENWKQNKTNLLFGIEYVWLNEKILKLNNSNKLNEKVQNVVFLAGGSDPTQSLLKFYNWAIQNYKEKNFNLKFLYGNACSYLDEIEELPKISNIEFVPFNEALIYNADVAVCAFGVTTYELIYLNIPTISYGHSPLHANASKRLEEIFNCVLNIGLLSEITENSFISSLNSLIENFQNREKLNLNCKNLIDGKGIDRFVESIEKL